MKKFKIYWINGRYNIITGTSLADAFVRAGFSETVMLIVDFWEEIKEGEK